MVIRTLGPVLLGYLAGAVAFGALATALHLSPVMVLGFSVLLYSGALQSTVLGMALLNPPFLVVVGVAFGVNLRHMLYGPHLESRPLGWRPWHRWLMAGLLTDELYALGLDENLPRSEWSWIGLSLYLVWILGTAIGVAGAHLLPERFLLAFSLALPSLFMGLLIPRLGSRADLAAALAAALLAIAVRVIHLPEAYELVPILAGATAGYAIYRRGREV